MSYFKNDHYFKSVSSSLPACPDPSLFIYENTEHGPYFQNSYGEGRKGVCVRVHARVCVCVCVFRPLILICTERRRERETYCACFFVCVCVCVCVCTCAVDISCVSLCSSNLRRRGNMKSPVLLCLETQAARFSGLFSMEVLFILSSAPAARHSHTHTHTHAHTHTRALSLVSSFLGKI